MVLTDAQQEVVTSLDTHILLLASAGTGKTNTLAHRIGHMIQTGVTEGARILCMTFTNKACKEMQDRILRIAGSEAMAVKVSTFHSFCYSIIREESKLRDDLYEEFVIYDEEDCAELLQPWKYESVKMQNFQGLISYVKEQFVMGDYEDYEATIRDLYKRKQKELRRFFEGALTSHDALSFEQNGHHIVTAYDQALREVHGMDFTDLIIKAYEILQDPAAQVRWQTKYEQICIDEMQDTSDLEYKVMKLLFGNSRLLLAGDYFQTIYEWRGSNPIALLADFKAYYQPKVIVFYENYRANSTLFNASFTVLKEMFPTILGEYYQKDPYAASKESGSPIVVHTAPTEFKEAAYIYEAIRHLPANDRNVGILVRSNRKAQLLSQLFERFNQQVKDPLQFLLVDEFKFFRRQEIKDIMAYFKLLVNPYDRLSAKRIIKRYVQGIGDARIKALEADEVRLSGLGLTDFMSTRIFMKEPYASLVEALEADNIIVYDVESTGVDTSSDYIIQIAAIRIDRQGKLLEKFERFIKPPISVGSSEMVHHFSDEYLSEHGEEAKDVLKDFLAFIKGRTIVGHNVGFDMSMLALEVNRHQLGPIEIQGVYDTLDMYRRFYPNLLNHKLGYLAEMFPTEHKPNHNALYDILATGELLVHIVDENILPTQRHRMAYIQQYRSHFDQIATQMDTLRRMANREKPTKLLAYIMNDMGVLGYYKSHGEASRVEYIRDLYRLLSKLEEEQPGESGEAYLRDILQTAALTAGEVDQRAALKKAIPIITVHQAKGSEFDHVFLAGMNESVFPSFMAIKEGKEEEEKRLFYVALTRAKQELTITYPMESNTQSGRKWQRKPSPFLSYLPEEYIKRC